jgi:ketosteroid isomerase-like protein
MSQENVKVVQALLARYMATGEVSWDLMHEEIEVYDHDVMDAADYRGHMGFTRWLENWSNAWAEFSIEPEEFIDAGPRVVTVLGMNATGRGSGVAIERQDAIVCEVRDAKIVRLDYYNNREQALQAVGLAE